MGVCGGASGLPRSAYLFPVPAVVEELRLRLHKANDLGQHIAGGFAVALLRLKESTGSTGSARAFAPVWREGQL